MYAVKFFNIHSGTCSYTAARGYADACEKMRLGDAELEANGWFRGEDYMSGVVDDLPDDFDFDGQRDWN